MIQKQEELLHKLRLLKKELAKEGFIIEGLFGSYARGDFSKDSDIDLLYRLEPTFLKKYRGFIGFKRLDEIKNYLATQLQTTVDLAPLNNLSVTGKKYILDEAIDV